MRRRKRSRDALRVRRKKKHRRVARVGARTQAEEHFRAYVADEPLSKIRHPRIERSWIDPVGITHRAICYYGNWSVLCDTPLFNWQIHRHGSNGLRYTMDTTTCLACIQIL